MTLINKLLRMLRNEKQSIIKSIIVTGQIFALGMFWLLVTPFLYTYWPSSFEIIKYLTPLSVGLLILWHILRIWKSPQTLSQGSKEA